MKAVPDAVRNGDRQEKTLIAVRQTSRNDSYREGAGQENTICCTTKLFGMY